MRRSMVLANSNLASAMSALTGGIVTKRSADLMSQRQKGTTVEACVGASYELDDFKITARVRHLTELVLSALVEELEEGCENPSVTETYDASVEKARSRLLEVMQKCGMSQKVARLPPFKYQEYSSKASADKKLFVATFLPKRIGGIEIGKVSSGPCASKKEAAEEASKIVLNFLHGKALKAQ